MRNETHARWRPNRMVRRVAASLVVTVAVSAAAPVGATSRPPNPRGSTSGGSWTTYGGNAARSSNQTISPRLLPIRSRWTSPLLDGGIYGEPLIDKGRVYVATENDTVFALNASTGVILWRRALGTPVPASALPCGDISPTIGVTSTMVIDPVTGRLFASGSTFANGTVRHLLFALDPTNGKIDFRRDLDRPGWTAAAELQRTGLGLDDGRVLVGFGGNYGDCGAYNGYLMGVPVTGHGPTLVFKVATAREGAIWAPSGVSINTAGHIFFATGNGSSETTRDEGDSVIELNSELRRISVFTPTEWLQDNASDLDLGSSAPILVSGNRVFVVGKEQTAYLLRGTNLGGFGGQLGAISACFAQGGDAYRASVVYIGCPTSSDTAIRIRGNSLSVLWRAPSGVNGSPTIAAGTLWAIAGGNLVAFSLATGAQIARIATLPVEHFAAPSAGDGLLVVAGTDQVQAFEGPTGYRP